MDADNSAEPSVQTAPIIVVCCYLLLKIITRVHSVLAKIRPIFIVSSPDKVAFVQLLWGGFGDRECSRVLLLISNCKSCGWVLRLWLSEVLLATPIGWISP